MAEQRKINEAINENYNALAEARDQYHATSETVGIYEKRIEELGAELKNLEKAIFLVGDGAELCYNTLRVSIPALRLLPEHLRGQRASGTALAAQAKIDAGEEGSGLELVPSYLRLSQAERTRMEQGKL